MNYINRLQREADGYGGYGPYTAEAKSYSDYITEKLNEINKNQIRDNKINTILDIKEDEPKNETKSEGFFDKLKSIFK